MKIAGRSIGGDAPVYIIAEMSANHGGSFEQAAAIVRAAKDAGADAVKLQTYTPDTLTIDSSNECFRVGKGTLWEGKTLYQLYGEAYTPWEWQPRLKALAEKLGLHCFSSPFDATSVDFLEKMDVPAYKVASFEVVDIPLLRKVGATRKPVIVSTGMASLAEIDEAVRTLRDAGCPQLALLKCTSAYPALPEEMNLRTIPHLSQAFGCPAGLSDHTMDTAVPVVAVALGASLIEKHLTLSRADGGPDAAFSLEPAEFRATVDAVRTAEKALGTVCYLPTGREQAGHRFRRSLFAVRDIRRGEPFTSVNVRSVRPADGLPPSALDLVLGRAASADIHRGTPLAWDLIG